MLCPCQSQNEFSQCCEPVLRRQQKASTAEQLMRARYSAFVQKDIGFIERTHDPKTREDFDMEASKAWATKSQWLGLEILRTEQGGPNDSTGLVEFKAKFDAGQGEEWHHGISRFYKRGGEWYFSDGKNGASQTYVRTDQKVGRNDPCTCGSGKKYKKCCG